MLAMEVFVKWMRANEAFLVRCRGHHLVVAYAGDEASTVCLYLLNGVSEDYGFTVSAVICPSPLHRYEDIQAIERVMEFWRDLGVPLRFAWTGEVDGERREVDDGCSSCRRRRAEAVQLALEKVDKGEVILVTGHHLVDVMALVVEQLLLAELDAEPGEARTLLSAPATPFGEGASGFTVYAPLHSLAPREIHSACQDWGLPCIEAPCRSRSTSSIGHLTAYLEGLVDRFSSEGALGFASRHLGEAHLRRLGSTIVSGT